MDMTTQMFKSSLITIGLDLLEDLQRQVSSDKFSENQLSNFKASMVMLNGYNPEFIRGFITGLTEAITQENYVMLKILAGLVILNDLNIRYLTGEEMPK